MTILKIIAVVIYTMFLYYRTGILFKKITKSQSKELSSTILYGCIINIAIFEIINIPFIIFAKNSTKILYVIYIVLNILYILLSYLIKRNVKDYNLITNTKNIKIEKNIQTLCFIIAIIIIIFQIFNSAFLFKQDADDSFYLSWANEARELEEMYKTSPMTGTEGSTFDNKYILNTWEIYGGFLARTFQLNTPTLFHTAYQILYIIIAYFAYYLILKKLLKKQNIGPALLILTILFMFSGVSGRFKGPFLLGRIYQGKSILLNVIMPFVIYKFLDYRNFRIEDYVILSLAYIAGVACNPITVWLLSIIYGLFMLVILVNKEFKTFTKSLLLLIPILIMCALFIVMGMNNQVEFSQITIVEEFNQMQDFKGFLGDGKTILILYIISVLVIIIKGNKIQKDLFIYLPILICVLVINPVLKDIYIKVVTATTYWRLYWIFPMELSIIVAATILYDIIETKKYKYIYLVSIIIVFILSGKYVYTQQLGFSSFENFEKIPQYIIDEINYIEKNSEGKVKAVTPNEPWHSCMVRQYSTQIQLMHTRDVQYVSDEKYKTLYYSIYGLDQTVYNIENINEILNIYDVDYIILPKEKILEVNDKCNFLIETETYKDYVVKAIKF